MNPGNGVPSLKVKTDASVPKNPFVVLVKLNKGGEVISFFSVMVWPREQQDLGGLFCTAHPTSCLCDGSCSYDVNDAGYFEKFCYLKTVTSAR